MEESYPCPKMTPRQWISNVWYYYKWLILLGVVILSFLTISAVQFLMKTDPDITLLYVGPARVGEEDCANIISYAESFLEDFNGDGEIKADLLTIGVDFDYEKLSYREQIQAMEKYQSYTDEILVGDCCILLLDSNFFESLCNSGVLVNLYAVFEELPPSACHSYGLRLGDTSLHAQAGFSSLPADTVLCLKYASPLTNVDLEDQVEEDIYNLSMFRCFVEGIV